MFTDSKVKSLIITFSWKLIKSLDVYVGPVQPGRVDVPLLLVGQRRRPRGDRVRSGRLRGRHQGGPARHEDRLRREERHARRNLPQRRLHTLQGIFHILGHQKKGMKNVLLIQLCI